MAPHYVGALIILSSRRTKNLAQVTLHDLRHTGASDVAAGGGSLVALRDILGHASLAMTSRYLWAAHGEMRQAIEGRAYRVAS